MRIRNIPLWSKQPPPINFSGNNIIRSNSLMIVATILNGRSNNPSMLRFYQIAVRQATAGVSGHAEEV
jgi:hypothetical protein